MALGRMVATLGCLAVAVVSTPASGQPVTARRVIVKDPTNSARGFYRLHARNNELLNEAELEDKAIRSRSFQFMNTEVRVLQFGWIIIPHCGTRPDARGRQALTSATPSPLEVTCP